jgi:hypothetical protein
MAVLSKVKRCDIVMGRNNSEIFINRLFNYKYILGFPGIMYCKRMKAENNFEKQTPRDAMQCHAMMHPLSRDICVVPPQRRRWKCSDEMSDEKGRDQKKRRRN